MYDLHETLHEGSDSRVLRGTRKLDGARVVVKQLRGAWPAPSELRRFFREHDLLVTLDGAGAPKGLGADVRDGVAEIAMESVPGVPLEEVMPLRLPLEEALPIARSVAAAVAAVHARDVQHRDLNPANVLVDRATAEARLVDFGKATTLARSVVDVRPLSALDGAPAYLAPEQTGRMNRDVDARADLYSLGATLYALFAGRPPFICADLLEYVHAHLARRPVELVELLPGLPREVSDLVMTLLEKRPEDRYQSAAGVVLDLGRCLDAWKGGARATLVGRALAERPELPRDLRGREREVARLAGLFDEVVAGARGVALLSGEPGIGKTSLAFELRGRAAVSGALVLEGKFEQLSRDVPFAALAHALGGFFADALSESQATADAWRARVQRAVGPNGRVLTDLVPAAEALLGPQPAVVELPPAEVEQRLQETIRRVIGAIAVRGRAVVLFLDDLQWADLPSLRVLETLFRDRSLAHFLLIGAWRDTEVSATHALTPTVAALLASGARVEALRLGPLGEDDVVRIVAAALHAEPESARELALVLHEKTRGNPFFLGRLVAELGDAGALWFDHAALRWRWDLATVRDRAVTDNVVTFTRDGLSRLSARARRCLAAAAWIGTRFDLDLLARVSGVSRDDLDAALLEATAHRMVVAIEAEPQREGDDAAPSFAFVHDRIQAAAGDLASPEEAARTRLSLARALRSGGVEADVFRVAEHYAAAMALVDDAAERAVVVGVYAEAGRRAMSSAAHAPASRFLEAALALAGPALWTDEPARARELTLLSARAAWLVGDLGRMREHVAELRARPGTAVDRLDAEWVVVQSQIARGELQEAITAALGALSGVGVVLPRTPTLDEVVAGVGGALAAIGERTASEIVQLPAVDDPVEAAARKLMLGIASASYIATPTLLPVLAATLVERSVARGVSRESSFGFGVFALSLAAGWNLALAYDYGRIALALLERLPDPRFGGRTRHVVNHFVRVWTEPVRDIYAETAELVRSLMDVGDLEYAGWVLHMQSVYGYFSGIPLDAQAAPLERAIATMREHHIAPPYDCTIGLAEVLRSLKGDSATPTRLVGDDFDEAAALARHEATGFRGAALVVSMYSLSVRVTFRDYVGAAEAARRAFEFQDGAVATFYQLPLTVLASIAELSCLDGLSPDDRATRVEAVRARRACVATAAAQSTQNGAHWLALFDAELAVVDGDVGGALALYDASIEAAAAGGFVQDEALAGERAALFHLARGARRGARAYMQEARFAWQRWGASAKVAQIDALHADLVGAVPRLRDASRPSLRPVDGLELESLVRPSVTLPSDDDSRPSERGASSMRISEALPTSTREPTRGEAAPMAAQGVDLDLMSVMKSSQAISEALVLDELVQRLMRALLENAAAQRGLLWLRGEPDLVVQATSGPSETRVVAQPASLDTRVDVAHSIVRYVERTKERVVLADASAAGRFQSDPYVAEARPKSLLCMPIVRQQRLVGVLYLENNLATDVFTESRCRMLEQLAIQSAISLENARLYDTLDARVKERTRQLEESMQGLARAQTALSVELQDAASYVRSLLPAPIERGPLRVSWSFVPSAHLGGDALGYGALDDGRLAFYVVDVAGHGLAAALLSISILTALHGRRLAADYGDPGAVLRALNDAFPSTTTGGRHFTIFYGVVDPRTRGLTCASGGHPAAVVCGDQGPPREVGEVGVMLGVVPDVDFPVTATTLAPDETIFVFSDGAFELTASDGALLPYERFLAALTDAARTADAPVAAMREFAVGVSGGALDDDFTMLALRLGGPERAG